MTLAMVTRRVFLTVLGIGVTKGLAVAQEPASPSGKYTESHRIRIVNRRLGTIQVSTDAGETWQLVGRVTQPCTGASEGYIAAEYAAPGAVAAVAVHGLRIRVSGEDPQLHAPLVLSIAPKELSTSKPNFGYGGHVGGMAGMQTDIPAGTSIFREFAPVTGNPVFLESRTGRLIPLPEQFQPKGTGEVLVIPVRVPVARLTQLVIENQVGGVVTGTFAGGETRQLTSVVQPVRGVGRFDGTSYTGVGRINTAHTGVITVSTAPINMQLPEGEGKERRGGFQISPHWHNQRTEEHSAPMMLVLGALGSDGKPLPSRKDLEGTAPLFLEHIGLFSDAAVVDCQIDQGDWEPLPTVLGVRLEAFTREGLNELWKQERKARTCSKGVTAFRFRFRHPSPESLSAALVATSESYRQLRLAEARTSKIPVVSGSVTINPTVTDPARVAYIRLSVDGVIKALKNFAPFVITWDTTRLQDGEYFIEIEALDASGAVLASTPRRVYIQNNKTG